VGGCFAEAIPLSTSEVPSRHPVPVSVTLISAQNDKGVVLILGWKLFIFAAMLRDASRRFDAFMYLYIDISLVQSLELRAVIDG